jgi:hypothetical protein
MFINASNEIELFFDDVIWPLMLFNGFSNKLSIVFIFQTYHSKYTYTHVHRQALILQKCEMLKYGFLAE